MKELLSAIARVFGVNTAPESHDTGMDTPIYDQLLAIYRQLNPDFNPSTKGE